MRKKYIALICLLMMIQVSSWAQKISISVKNEPLSDVLVQLRDSYDLAFSFNDAELRNYRISVDKEFQSTEEVLSFLLKDYPLTYEKVGDVFVIYTEKTQEPPTKPTSHVLTGRIVERKTLESLPYTTVAINETGTISDVDGYFSYRSTDSIFRVQISHLGYYQLDTMLTPDKKHLIKLTPSVEQLKEVVISDRLVETFLYSEDQAATLRMNHKITRFLPGSSNNSVFNLLRLQSGILASAESAENLIIWGSYEGQSRILYDDILLFGLKNFNDNIGTVNPLVVKDIKLMKAAFGANYGNTVGGIADITGKDGNRKNFSMDFIMDNYALNTRLETPVSENASLIFAFRHTYRNLYESKEWDLTPNRETNINSDVTIQPDYRFRDLNLKYTFRNEQDFHVQLSLIGGQDKFNYSVDEMLTRWFQLKRNTTETSLQKGASLIIGKESKEGFNLQYSMTYSSLNNRYENDQRVTNTFNNSIRQNISQLTHNNTREAHMKLKSKWAVNENHQLESSLSWVANSSSWHEDTSGVDFINQDIKGSHITFMVQDQMNYGKLKLKPGIRISRLPYLGKNFWEPRVSVSYSINKDLNMNMATGLYRQYLTKNSVEDEYGNFRYMWVLANDSEYPVLRAKHLTASLTFDKKKTQASLTPFYKKINGLTRYVNFPRQNIETVSTGHGRSYGVDFYLKQNMGGHTAWVSYILSKTEEWYEHYPTPDYLYAPQDQRHELKLSALLNFDPIYLSANYIYGSGFPIPEFSSTGINYYRTPYHRLDVAFTWKINLKDYAGEAGISILNVFNRENLLYNNLERVPTSQISTIRIYQQSVPFTPIVFLKMGF